VTPYAAADHPILFLLAVAVAGISLGIGLVVGVWVARSLRRYIDTDDHDTRGDPMP